jgi:type I restriction enzyme R subunit
LMDQAKREYLPITAGKSGDKAVEACLDHFRDAENRQKFYQFYGELEECYEIISPDAFLRPHIRDYQELTSMYRVVRASYERSVPVDKSFLRKTAKLVQEHTQTGEIQQPQKIHKLTAETLEQIAGEERPETVKVFNLLKALHDMVAEKAQHEPYLISIGEKAEQIANAFEVRQKTTQECLEELERLVAELREAEQQRDDTELSPEAFAIYWMLKREGVEHAQKVAQAAAKAFDENPYWQTSSHHEQGVRKALYKALIEAKIDGVVELAQNIMRMLQRAKSDSPS